MTSGRPPALVLLDHDIINQPGGAELLKTADELKLPTLLMLIPGADAPSIPIDRPQIASINKPLRTATLIRRLETLFGTSPKTVAPDQAKRTKLADDLPLSVLLVEDNLVNQKVASRFLDRMGYSSDLASNGVEGVAAAENKSYDLILMDVQMPEMDGFTASREIRKRLPADAQPKIVALTANALQGDRELCLDAGMDDYITKPVKMHELTQVIRRQFSPSPGAKVPSAED